MREAVLPLEMILFQVLFLLVAIALEARVLHRKLKFTRKTSVEYATSINLFATVFGWLTFFALAKLLPGLVKAQLVSYIFFDRFIGPQPDRWNSLVVLVGTAIFFFTFFIKLLGLQLLKAWLKASADELKPAPKLLNQRRPGLINRQEAVKTSHFDQNPALAILLANAYSYSTILLILLLRFFQFSTIQFN
ncbi:MULTISPECIES: filament integrity protein FraC [unclassified Coleofasciculus]|uniref:filament integrity protein FraC n=1 Tax=unclassified Coleofasciculus TaxID=2692782 RepID=UPI001883055E|nr:MULTISPECIES: filament integrity protein FraC [unclassified Coleofasciculus]MBE9127500.1 filament integrity protein fraC [Coleofasciculus sp. LEGE 07081]MBE9150838.1 filament integrity protein fraC [Coleofasciculus sp. LEGE 07092]